MKKLMCLFIFLFVALCVYARGKIEYTVTEVLTVDDREKNQDTNYFGGDYFTYSNTLTDHKGNTQADLDINSKPGYNGSKACIHFSYALDPKAKNPFAGAGTNLKADYSVMDFSSCFGLRFYAKGTGQVYIRLATEASRKTYNDYQSLIDLKPEWTLYEIPFSDFKIPDYGPRYPLKTSEIYDIGFGNSFVAGAKADMYIDDIGFFKAKIKESQAPEVVTAEKDQSKKTDTAKSSDTKAATQETGQKKLSQKKLDEVTGKRIAVVGLSSQNIDSKVTSVLIDFIINAFVNSGSVKVVDRSSIEKILKEQEFQMQDFVDSAKASEIGKLLGAEYVVTGGLNKIDQTIYLSIKLVSVKTAEIIGSSVTSAPEKSDYVDLCNEAVLKLFM
jgi:TolB-like protein